MMQAWDPGHRILLVCSSVPAQIYERAACWNLDISYRTLVHGKSGQLVVPVVEYELMRLGSPEAFKNFFHIYETESSQQVRKLYGFRHDVCIFGIEFRGKRLLGSTELP